jgi:hypothetical protein
MKLIKLGKFRIKFHLIRILITQFLCNRGKFYASFTLNSREWKIIKSIMTRSLKQHAHAVTNTKLYFVAYILHREHIQ